MVWYGREAEGWLALLSFPAPRAATTAKASTSSTTAPTPDTHSTVYASTEQQPLAPPLPLLPLTKIRLLGLFSFLRGPPFYRDPLGRVIPPIRGGGAHLSFQVKRIANHRTAASLWFFRRLPVHLSSLSDAEGYHRKFILILLNFPSSCEISPKRNCPCRQCMTEWTCAARAVASRPPGPFIP